ncbi:hypothetical protein T05_10219 [Trichinella murrelli]|uniref:Uncharacterized protein n=1 Tax=Trichinella murrelli TaxID=144512 RepID=A0A0V0U250_9BILA|nr:hypothetical protein T05_10219 [Trichinella murrelli]
MYGCIGLDSINKNKSMHMIDVRETADTIILSFIYQFIMPMFLCGNMIFDAKYLCEEKLMEWLQIDVPKWEHCHLATSISTAQDSFFGMVHFGPTLPLLVVHYAILLDHQIFVVLVFILLGRQINY